MFVYANMHQANFILNNYPIAIFYILISCLLLKNIVKNITTYVQIQMYTIKTLNFSPQMTNKKNPIQKFQIQIEQKFIKNNLII